MGVGVWLLAPLSLLAPRRLDPIFINSERISTPASAGLVGFADSDFCFFNLLDSRNTLSGALLVPVCSDSDGFAVSLGVNSGGFSICSSSSLGVLELFGFLFSRPPPVIFRGGDKDDEPCF